MRIPPYEIDEEPKSTRFSMVYMVYTRIYQVYQIP